VGPEPLEQDDALDRQALLEAVMYFVSEFPGAGWALRGALAEAWCRPSPEAARETF
jgi:hypothetical protein